MPDRIQITSPTYMRVDGQWDIVLGGSVIDVPSADNFKNHTKLTETPGAIPSGHGATSVRNLRRKR